MARRARQNRNARGPQTRHRQGYTSKRFLASVTPPEIVGPADAETTGGDA